MILSWFHSPSTSKTIFLRLILIFPFHLLLVFPSSHFKDISPLKYYTEFCLTILATRPVCHSILNFISLTLCCNVTMQSYNNNTIITPLHKCEDTVLQERIKCRETSTCSTHKDNHSHSKEICYAIVKCRRICTVSVKLWTVSV